MTLLQAQRHYDNATPDDSEQDEEQKDHPCAKCHKRGKCDTTECGR